MSLTDISTEELQAEIDRRKAVAVEAELERRRDVRAVLLRACREIPDFKRLLFRPQAQLTYKALLCLNDEYILCVRAYYEPLNHTGD